MTQFYFANEQNKHSYQTSVLKWLKEDFKKKGYPPSNHFWHNRSMIQDAFNECRAMVAFDDDKRKKQPIGFMIWSFYNGGAEIDIVQVKEAYRRKKVFSGMLDAFAHKFSTLLMLTASALESARPVFTNMGWNTVALQHQIIFYKPLHLHLAPQSLLPDGLVMAVCSEDFFTVKNNRQNYSEHMRYYSLDMNTDGNLPVPIITPCSQDSYIGFYRDKILITEKKPKHLEGTVGCYMGIILMNKIAPSLLTSLQPLSLKREREEELSSETAEQSSVKKVATAFSYRAETSGGSSLFNASVNSANSSTNIQAEPAITNNIALVIKN